MKSAYKVSIIIPFYNAQKSIIVSLESVLNQNYSNIELVLINDCSVDNTLEVVKNIETSFLKKGVEFCLYSHEFNQGVASARNTGLHYATGDLVYFLDADDWIEANAIEVLVNEHIRSSADIVGCDWFLSFGQNERKMTQPNITNPLSGIQAILNGSMRWNLWLFLVRRSLYEDNKIRFIPGRNMGEDLAVMVKLFVEAKKVVHIPSALYHYGQTNENSLTKQYTDKHINEVTENVKEVEHTLNSSRYKGQLGDGLDFLKLNIKLPLLISDNRANHQLWKVWFPESNGKIMQNRVQPLRTKLLQWMADKNQFWAVKLYYKLIIRFIYGSIYK